MSEILLKKILYVHDAMRTLLYVEYETGHFSPIPTFKKRTFRHVNDENPHEVLVAAIRSREFIKWEDAEYREVLQQFLA